VDASALAQAFTGTPETAEPLRARLECASCHAPHLIDAELGSALRRLVGLGIIAPDEALASLRAGRDVIDERYPHTGSIGDGAWALRRNFSFYDALYVAMAAQFGLTLLTGDGRLANAPKRTCAVELV
jgi:predicted nucleic acid-binding protein